MALALAIHEATLCSGCGQDMAYSMDLDLADEWTTGHPDRCFACTALERASDRVKESGAEHAAALKREFMEELGVEIAIAGAPMVMENIYRHEGAAGHEIAFLYPVSLPEGAFAAQERIPFREDDGTPGCAGWYDPAELDLPDGPALFPAGLKHLLRG